MKSICLAAIATAILSTSCARNEEAPVQPQLSNDALQQMVKTRLQSDENVARLNLGVDADAEHNAVQLNGLAYTQLQRTRAVELARGAHEGVAVEDKIDVKPYEIPRDLFDDQMMEEVKAESTKMGDQLGTSLDDGWLHMKVVAKLIADSQTPERKINVDVMDAVVTLRGNVDDQATKNNAEEVAKSVEGVKQVRNRLVVKPS